MGIALRHGRHMLPSGPLAADQATNKHRWTSLGKHSYDINPIKNEQRMHTQGDELCNCKYDRGAIKKQLQSEYWICLNESSECVCAPYLLPESGEQQAREHRWKQ